MYISSIYIDEFRGFKDFEILGFKDINILAGSNNTRKTSILEAINILEYPDEIGNYINVCRQREGKSKVSLYNIFINSITKDDTLTHKEVKIKGVINNKTVGCFIEGEVVNVMSNNINAKTLKSFQGTICSINQDIDNRNYKKVYIDEESDRLNVSSTSSFSPIKITTVLPFDHVDKEMMNTVIKEGKRQEIVDVLKIFDKDIIGFEMIKEDEEIKTYINHNITGLLPISTYGDGLKKVVYLSSVIINARDGILLIDEIETAIHHGALEEVFKWFIDACNRYNVQLFATTHSLEALDALLESAMKYKGSNYLKDSINLITLKRGNDYYDTKARVLDGFSAYEMRENLK